MLKGFSPIFLVPCATFLLVRVEVLEPPCLAASDPKSDTSANFATPAFIMGCKSTKLKRIGERQTKN